MPNETEIETTSDGDVEISSLGEKKPKPKRRIGYAYTGAGTFFQGIPARDLSVKEWDALPLSTRDALLQQGLYKEQKK